MNHEDLSKLIARQLDKEITPQDASILESLLRDDPAAKDEMAAAVAMRSMLQRDSEQIGEATPGLDQRIMDRISTDSVTNRTTSFRLTIPRVAAVAAAALIMVGLAFWAGRTTVEARVSPEDKIISEDMDELEALGVSRSSAQAAFDNYRRQVQNLQKEHSLQSAALYRELEATLAELRAKAAKKR